MEPWICPRCETVWAGWVAKCTCKPLRVTTSGSTAVTMTAWAVAPGEQMVIANPPLPYVEEWLYNDPNNPIIQPLGEKSP